MVIEDTVQGVTVESRTFYKRANMSVCVQAVEKIAVFHGVSLHILLQHSQVTGTMFAASLHTVFGVLHGWGVDEGGPVINRICYIHEKVLLPFLEISQAVLVDTLGKSLN